MQTINNVQVADSYTDALTLGPIPTAEKIVYLVANASVYAQVAGHSDSGTVQEWGDEILITPQASEFQRIQGIRFKNAIAGTPARVIAQLVQPDDPIPVGGTPFTLTLSGSGGTTGGQGALFAATTIAGLNALAGSPPPDGAGGRLELGITPFDEELVVYSTALGKWVTAEHWYHLGSVLGSVSGVSIGNAFAEIYINSGNGLLLQPPSIPWSVYDAAGLKPQFRWIGDLSNDGSGIGCQSSIRLGYRGMGLGTGIDGIVDFGAGSQIDGSAVSPSDTPADTGWKDLPGGATVRTFLIASPLGKATTAGRGAWHHGSHGIRWVG